MCQEILERLKSLVHPNATELIKHYDEQLDIIKLRLGFIESAPEEKVTIDDLEDKDVNFFSLLSEFEGRFYNKAELAVLTEQFTSLFEDNPLLENLGAHLSDIPVEKKRNPRGFESNFVYIDTPIGRIECQLQTEDQYRFGNYGFAAHTKMTGKKLYTVKIPPALKLRINEKIQEVKERIHNAGGIHNIEGIDEFLDSVHDISPDTYLSRMDDNERGRVMTIEFGDYQNYKKVVSQVADNDPSERFLYNYFAKLYPVREILFDKEEHSLGFIRTDVEEYIESDEFKHFLDIAPLINKDYLQENSIDEDIER